MSTGASLLDCAGGRGPDDTSISRAASPLTKAIGPGASRAKDKPATYHRALPKAVLEADAQLAAPVMAPAPLTCLNNVSLSTPPSAEEEEASCGHSCKPLAVCPRSLLGGAAPAAVAAAAAKVRTIPLPLVWTNEGPEARQVLTIIPECEVLMMIPSLVQAARDTLAWEAKALRVDIFAYCKQRELSAARLTELKQLLTRNPDLARARHSPSNVSEATPAVATP
jgi:hypothetical protein